MPAKDSTSAYPRLTLTPGLNERISSGHPWVYSSEVRFGSTSLEPGQFAVLQDSQKHVLGTGYVNPNSMIAFRMLSHREVKINLDWVRTRLEEAQACRERFLPGRRVYRLVHSEGDGLPGIIIDRYDKVYVVSSSTAGGDRLVGWILEVLAGDFDAEVVIEKSDHPLRGIEGESEQIRTLEGELPDPLLAQDDELVWEIDVFEGQKTGHYLDRESNRRRVRELCRGKSVLDAFCYTGAWSLHAAAGGAKSVLGIDTSRLGIAAAQRNAKRNGFSGMSTYRTGDALKVLPVMQKKKQRFDVVIIDPPAFAESKAEIEEALLKYEELNRAALRLVKPPGILVTCSCTNHLFQDGFVDILRKASQGVRRRIRIVDVRGAGPDHPMHPTCLETEYLTCAILHVT